MKQLEIEDFFSQITSAFLYEKGFYEYFIRHGFDPELWPQVSVRAVACEFHAMAKQTGFINAKLRFRAKISMIETIDLPDKIYPVQKSSLKIPWHDGAAIIVMFEEYKNYALHYQLGSNLVDDAHNGSAILSKFKNNPAASAVSFLMQERLEDHIRAQIEKSKSGTAMKVIIPDWKLLSELIGGFNPQRISMIVAATGVGKTTLALNLMLSAIKTIPSLYVNMEMGEKDILDRLCQIGSGITSRDWEQMGDEAQAKSAGFLSKTLQAKHLYYTDGQSLTIEQIANRIYFHAENHDVKLVFVDYDQKIRIRSRLDEWAAVQKAVEELEGVAKQSNVHICILAQGDEQNQPKASKRSTQPASAVLAFYKNESNDYIIETKKNRFGPRDEKIKVICDFSQYRITELENYIQVPRPVNNSMYK